MAVTERAVLVACGSFSPITYAHLRMFEVARDHLVETVGYGEVAGVISPVSDHYGKAGLAHALHRVEMCRLATIDSDWIAVDPWESQQKQHMNTVPVLEKLSTRHQGDVFFLAGSDLVNTFQNETLWAPADVEQLLTRFRTIVVERAASPLEMGDTLLSKLIRVQERIYSDVSSTVVRRNVREGRSIMYLTPKPVVDYIAKAGLYVSGTPVMT